MTIWGRIAIMKKITSILAGAAFALAANAVCAQAQDNTISSGPFRFGLSASPANSSPFGNSAARYEKDNPANRSPLESANAAPAASGEGPKLGPEGGGTPMSRGGINDTLTGSNPAAALNAPPPVAKPKAKHADKPKTANIQGEKPKP